MKLPNLATVNQKTLFLKSIAAGKNAKRFSVENRNLPQQLQVVNRELQAETGFWTLELVVGVTRQVAVSMAVQVSSAPDEKKLILYMFS